MASEFEPITSLRVEHITKSFPGVLACDDISLEVNKGDILAIVGENGAGKSTLMNILMGIYTPDEGRILINGKKMNFRSPKDALACGIGMVHQRFMLVPELTVTENIALGMKNAAPDGTEKGFGKRIHDRLHLDLVSVRKRIGEVSAQYGLTVDPDAYIWQLSVGEQQKVELVKTLCLGAKLLILDEPTSALTPQETDELIALLRRMAEKISIIFISHKLAEVKALCNSMIVLRSGRLIYSGSVQDHSAEEIAKLMTGHEVHLTVDRPAQNVGEEILKIENLCAKGDRGNLVLDQLSLTVRAGEIVGLAGVSGNGQRELAEAISGLRKVKSGSILFDGVPLTDKTPVQIVRMGLMSYIPEERNVEGIVPGMDVRENLILKDIRSPKFNRRGILMKRKIERNARELCQKFDVRGDVSAQAGSLSGGNIQKVILAREISRDPKFLVAVYPIRGLDMGAAEFIHNQMLDLRDRGVGILLISEEMEEVLNLSDRIAVIFKGGIREVLNRGEATQSRLGILMAGVDEHEA